MEQQRKLASIQRVIAIDPIEGADNIECATILGWHLCVKKGEFKVGDLAVYCEVDSIMPPKEEFAFLADVNYRIKIRKFRKQISEGIAFPLDILGENNKSLKEGDDVTEIMGVTKYESPEENERNNAILGGAKGRFPSFIHKTDETRVQAIPWIIETCKDIPFYAAVKVDGSSFTCYLKDWEFGVCSRNMNLKRSDANSFWQLAIENQLEEKLRTYCKQTGGKVRKFFSSLFGKRHKNIAIQGEMAGQGIQSNRSCLNGRYLFVFNVYDIDKKEYFNLAEMQKFCSVLGLRTVPIVKLKDDRLPASVDECVKMADEIRVFDGKEYESIQDLELKKKKKPIIEEGLVFRPLETTIQIPRYGRASFKAIAPSYLLKHKL